MSVRGKSRWRRTGGLASGLLLLALTAGCSHPVGSNRPKDPNLPFHQGAQSDAAVADNQTHDLGQNRGTDQPGPGPAPFNAADSWNLPAGTLLTVRLQESLAGGALNDGQAFAAVVDEPVAIDGYTVIDVGAFAHGRVESSRTSDVQHDPGYIRLTLDSVTVSGRPIPIQTSTLFARGSAAEGQAVSVSTGKSDSPPLNPWKITRLKKGRRLTFRLTSNLAVPTSAAQVQGENSSSPHD